MGPWNSADGLIFPPARMANPAPRDQGQPGKWLTWRDVVNVPAQSRVRVSVDFTRHRGRSVYYCHILDHEDAGMREGVEVQ